jgi:hypothetical protein
MHCQNKYRGQKREKCLGEITSISFFFNFYFLHVVLLVTGIHSNKEMTKKIKRPKNSK